MTKTTESATTTKATATTPGTQDAPQSATTAKVAKTSKNAPKGTKTASKPVASKKASKKGGKPAAKKTPKASAAAAPREGSKKQIVLLLLARKDGATMAEIADATGWQNHSIRGFISGNVSRKMGLAVESSKNAAGERTYRITGK